MPDHRPLARDKSISYATHARVATTATPRGCVDLITAITKTPGVVESKGRSVVTVYTAFATHRLQLTAGEGDIEAALAVPTAL